MVLQCDDDLMLSSVQAPPYTTDNDPVTDVPRDWPELWLRILRARDGAPTPQLTHRPERGWQVEDSVSARASALFDVYKPLIDVRARQRGPRAQGPWVVAQLGQSLDGFVATATGDSYYVNGAHCLLHLHRLRALCDAVLVGAGTVATDNPQLTTRRVPGPQPVRVVMDPAARLDGLSRVFRDGQAPTLWVCDSRHAAQARTRLGQAPQRAEVLAVDDLLTGDTTGAYHPQRAVAALAQRGLRLLFVEGGGITVSRFFTAGALDRLHLVVAPVLIGNGRRGLQAPAHAVMADCPRPQARTLALGQDMLWDLELRSS